MADRGRLTKDLLEWTQDANTSAQVRMTPGFTGSNATLTFFSTDSTANLVNLKSVRDPVAAQDAATKAYVDAQTAGAGLWKQPVRVATTVAGTLATSFANGQTVDGVTLATNDRILIKNQASATENGIYIVQAAGAPTRATDYASSADVFGAASYVLEGTANGDTSWIQVTDPGIVATNLLSYDQLTPGTAAGSNTEIQFNDGGSFGADSSFTFDKATNIVTLGDEGGTGTISGTDATTATTVGTNLTIDAGDGNTTGNGGAVSITGGDGGATDASTGGAVSITGGSSTATNGDGANVNIGSGDGTGTGAAGDVVLTASTAGTGADGVVQVVSSGVQYQFSGDTISSNSSVAIEGAAGSTFDLATTTTTSTVSLATGLTSGTLNMGGGAADINIGTTGNAASVISLGSATSNVIITKSDFTLSNSTAVVNKGYVDAVAAGLTWKDAARVATLPGDMTASTYATSGGDGKDTITWVGVPTIDGVTVAVNDRILVKDDAATTGTNSQGIYVVTSITTNLALERSDDALGAGGPAIQASGAALFVTEDGTVSGDKAFVCITDAADFGDDISFAQFSGGAGGAAGPDNSIQYNSGSNTFAGVASYQFNGTNTVTLGTEATTSTLTAPTATTADTAGGALTVSGGSGLGTGNGGELDLSAGASGAGATGNGGVVDINAGAATSTNGNGGDVTIDSGDGSGTGTGGNIVLTASTAGAGTDGSVQIATSSVLYTFAGDTLSSNAAVDIQGAAASTFDLATTTTTGAISLGSVSTGAIEIGSASDSCLVSFNSTLDATAPGTAGVTIDGGLGVAENVFSTGTFGFWAGASGSASVRMFHNGTDSVIVSNDSGGGDLFLNVADTTSGSHVRIDVADQTYANAAIAKETGSILEVQTQQITLSDTATATDSSFVSISAPSYTKATAGISTITDATTLYVESPTASANAAITDAWSIWANGDVRANEFIATSDAAVKENIELLSDVTEDPLSLLRQIEGYQYNWKPTYSNNKRKQWGVLAQQLESIGIDNAVTGTSQKAVNYLFLIPLLIEAVKQLADITTEEVECD